MKKLSYIMKALIAEPNRASRTLLEKILKNMDHEVVAVEDADVLDVDADMYFLTEELGALDIAQEVDGYIFMVSPDKEETIRELDMIPALKAGVDDFLIKPLERESVERRVREAERVLNGLEGQFDAVDQLEQEHELLKRTVNIFQVISSRFKGEMSQKILDWMGSTALRVDLENHHRKEINFLLTFLQKAIQEQGESPSSRLFSRSSLKTVEEEHDSLEDMVEELQDMTDEDPENVIRKIDRYSSLLREHLEREERFLFPLARKYLGEEEMKDLQADFDEVGGYENFERKLADIEDILGITQE